MALRQVEDLPLTEQCHHYDSLGQVPWDIQKYWHQRYSIFSRYDEDIHLTDDAWFGVTPEPVALKVASDLGTLTPSTTSTVVDLFAGAGGNSIAFAQSGRWATVVAVERDAATLACAMHNAAVYGVRDHITWVLGDVFEFLARLREGRMRVLPSGGGSSNPGSNGSGSGSGSGSGNGNGKSKDKGTQIDPARTTVFASPPWGGVGYVAAEVFDVEAMQPYGLGKIHAACGGIPLAVYLPRTSDLRQIAALAPQDGDGKKIEVVQYCMYGASKAMVAYIPGSQRRASA